MWLSYGLLVYLRNYANYYQGTIMSQKCISKVDDLCIQTIRFLSVDAIQAAKSGHPGMPMGMAAAAYTLWTRHLRHDPNKPGWTNRDRFVLSAGHGSMLLYSLLYLNGYGLTLDELKNFRQWGSRTAGHPEYGMTPGVEVTTGPLGQGLSNAVGMAIAQKYLAARYNKDGFDLYNNNIYVICGDGCLQEGISSEASSLAGHLALDNLIVIYDDNHVTIDGNTSLSFTENQSARYCAYGWNVIEVDGDGMNNIDALNEALETAKSQTKAPTIIKFRSQIGYGSPNMAGTSKVHGAPLGEDEIKLMKQAFDWDPDKKFHVPAEVLEHFKPVAEKGKALTDAYDKLFAEYSSKYPELAKEITDAKQGKLPIDIDSNLPKFDAAQTMATRTASGKTLNALMQHMPLVIGGSADLTPSNNTWFDGAEDFQKDNHAGRYIRYGVREHAMAAIMNGISVCGIQPYGGTFMVFADYMRGAIRLAALSHYSTIFVCTHDSIGVGEDGPTHQPVEHVASLRAIPNLLVFRPADANETAHSWKYALENKQPSVLALTRQNLPILDQEKYDSAAGVKKGAYVLVGQDEPDVLLLASGSEVQIVMAAAEKLAADGIKAQVVSMPCWELFERQDQAYKDTVLPPNVTARVGVEAGVDSGWYKWIGLEGEFVGMHSFGASGPQNICFEQFGITIDNVVAAAKKTIG